VPMRGSAQEAITTDAASANAPAARASVAS